MNEKSKVIILLMTVLLSVTAAITDVENLIEKNSSISKIDIVYILAGIFFIYIALSYFISKIIFEIIGSVNLSSKNKSYMKLESLVANIPGGILSLSYINNSWNVNYVSLWCYKFLGYNREIPVDKEKIFNAICDSDKDAVEGILKDILAGSEYGETEVRIKDNRGQIIWVKIKINGIYSSSGELHKVTAIIIDINDVKVENEKLLFKTQHDSMTGVLNKVAIEKIVEDYTTNDRGQAAFIVIDIDNFKLFNDLLGHIYGDEAIFKVVECLKKVFNNNSYIARLGGDEFCVFIPDVNAQAEVIEKVEKFLQELRHYRVGDEKKLNILVSMGISEFPVYGKGFRELYINADKALYLTKFNGKNGYSIYK